MRTRVAVLFACVGLWIAVPAHAQLRKYQVNFGGGYTAASGQIRKHLGDGGNFAIGVNYNARPRLAFQAQYAYSPFGAKQFDIPAQPGTNPVTLFVGHHMHEWTFNGISYVGEPDRMVRPYGVGGLGIYTRSVKITTPSTGLTTVCDPYWYICAEVPVAVEQVVGARGTTDFGINIGGGVAFGPEGHPVRFYVEARYHYMWGPKAGDLAGVAGGSTVAGERINGQYFPITFGIKF
jgi:opacity protein-like surface antigen